MVYRMSTFTSPETAACRALVELALREDLGERGDITSQAFLPAEQRGAATFIARSPGVLAGLPAARLVFEMLDPQVEFRLLLSDGSILKRGDRIATVDGPIRSILTGERTALNFMQRLSG